MTTVPDTDAGLLVLPSPEDVGSICGDVWTCYVDAVNPLDQVEDVALPGAGVVAAVDVVGAWNHTITLTLPDDTAWPAACAMVRLEAPTTPVAHDALGELVNMIGGNVKSLMPAPSHLGSPRVTTTPDLSQSGQGSHPLMTVALLWEGRPFTVSVHASAGHPATGLPAGTDHKDQ